MIRQKLYSLEQTQIKMKQECVLDSPYRARSSPTAANMKCATYSYETEIRMLRHELESRGVQPVSHIAPAAHTGPQGQPPQVGHGPSNLFSGIMANPGGSGTGLVPPLTQDQPSIQHTLHQPAPAALPGALQPSGSYGGYPPGVGMCE